MQTIALATPTSIIINDQAVMRGAPSVEAAAPDVDYTLGTHESEAKLPVCPLDEGAIVGQEEHDRISPPPAASNNELKIAEELEPEEGKVAAVSNRELVGKDLALKSSSQKKLSERHKTSVAQLKDYKR